MAFDKIKPEPAMPTSMQHNDDFIKPHQTGGFQHHSAMIKPNAAGHTYNSDMVKTMCGGGKVKK